MGTVNENTQVDLCSGVIYDTRKLGKNDPVSSNERLGSMQKWN